MKLKKFLFLFLFLFLSSCSFSNTNTYFTQGKFLSDNDIRKVEIGMGKSFLIERLGNPTFIFSDNIDCLCYYYLSIPINYDLKIIRKCVLLFFEDDFLVSYKVLI